MKNFCTAGLRLFLVCPSFFSGVGHALVLVQPLGGPQGGHGLQIRLLVHAEEAGKLVLGEEAGGGLVGQQHALLDPGMGGQALARIDAGRHAFGVQLHLGLRELEIDEAVLAAALEEDRGELVQGREEGLALLPAPWASS